MRGTLYAIYKLIYLFINLSILGNYIMKGTFIHTYIHAHIFTNITIYYVL